MSLQTAMRELPDVLVTNEGSIYLVQPISRAGREWIEANVYMDEAQMWGDSLVVEHSYIVAIVDGLHDEGLIVR